jgi:hypothetical protein
MNPYVARKNAVVCWYLCRKHSELIKRCVNPDVARMIANHFRKVDMTQSWTNEHGFTYAWTFHYGKHESVVFLWKLFMPNGVLCATVRPCKVCLLPVEHEGAFACPRHSRRNRSCRNCRDEGISCYCISKFEKTHIVLANVYRTVTIGVAFDSADHVSPLVNSLCGCEPNGFPFSIPFRTSSGIINCVLTLLPDPPERITGINCVFVVYRKENETFCGTLADRIDDNVSVAEIVMPRRRPGRVHVQSHSVTMHGRNMSLHAALLDFFRHDTNNKMLALTPQTKPNILKK